MIATDNKVFWTELDQSFRCMHYSPFSCASRLLRLIWVASCVYWLSWKFLTLLVTTGFLLKFEDSPQGPLLPRTERSLCRREDDDPVGEPVCFVAGKPQRQKHYPGFTWTWLLQLQFIIAFPVHCCIATPFRGYCNSSLQLFVPPVHSYCNTGPWLLQHQSMVIAVPVHGYCNTYPWLLQHLSLVIATPVRGYCSSSLRLLQHQSMAIAVPVHGYFNTSPWLLQLQSMVISTPVHGYCNSSLWLLQFQSMAISTPVQGCVCSILLYVKTRL